MQRFFILFLGCLFFLTLSISNAEECHLYSTWDSMETDKLASAWLIKRFVDEKAEFKFYPVGELISEGVPFDTPDAELRRYRNMSTFEAILKKYQIEDKCLTKIAVVTHFLEIISWRKKMKGEHKKIDETIKKIIKSSESKEECLEKSIAFFDNYYDSLKTAEEDKEKPEEEKEEKDKSKS